MLHPAGGIQESDGETLIGGAQEINDTEQLEILSVLEARRSSMKLATIRKHSSVLLSSDEPNRFATERFPRSLCSSLTTVLCRML